MKTQMTLWRAVIAVSVGCFTAATGVALAADAESRAPLKRIIGTQAANVLRGTASPDFIDGRAGNDVLYGFAGNDRLIGGKGVDEIHCGRGRDIVWRDADDDKVGRDCELVRGARPPPPPAVPEQLLGTWNRFIDETTAIDLGHVANHIGIWSITFQRNGIAVIEEPEGAHGPGRFVLYGTFSATADGWFLTGVGNECTTRGSYRWETVGAILRFHLVTDVCLSRAAVLRGDWHR
jgi:RTX calcium-binding nonapeptide repeat (4 copies)